MAHLDFFGQQLAEGDRVAVERTNCRRLAMATVVSLSKKGSLVHLAVENGFGGTRAYMTPSTHCIKRPA